MEGTSARIPKEMQKRILSGFSKAIPVKISEENPGAILTVNPEAIFEGILGRFSRGMPEEIPEKILKVSRENHLI